MMFIIIGLSGLWFAGHQRRMAGELHLDCRTAGSVYSVYMLMAGPLARWWRCRPTARAPDAATAPLVVAGALFMARVTNSGALAIVGAGVIVGTGVVTGSAIGLQACLARWFVRRRALVISILYSGGAIGGFVAPPPQPP
ncbi:MAG: hypothetical protein U1F06_02110 [Steroidobacteraceae bacterium]